MRKILYFLLFSTFIFIVTACGSGKKEPNKTDSVNKKENFDNAQDALLKSIEKQLNGINDSLAKFTPTAKMYLRRSALLFQKGEVQNAILDTKRAIELEPNNADYYYQLGLYQYVLAKDEDALASYQKSIALGSNNPAVYVAAGMMFFHENKMDNAMNLYKEALKKKENYPSAYFGMALVSRQKGNVVETRKLLEKTLALDSTFSNAYMEIGLLEHEDWYRLKAKKDSVATKMAHQKTMKWYEKAVKINDNNADAHYNIGVLLQENEEIDKAIFAYNKCLSINKNYENAYYNRGLLFWKKENYAYAKEDFSHAIQLNANYAQAYYMRGTCFEYLNDKENAFSDYKMATMINPNYVDAQNALKDMRKVLGKPVNPQ